MTAAPPVSEAALQRAVLDYARRQGFLAAHFNDSRKQLRSGRLVGDQDAAGWPDLALVRDDRFLIVELKAQGGKLSDAQREWLTRLALAGVEVHVWRPSDWPEIERTLARTFAAHQSGGAVIRAP